MNHNHLLITFLNMSQAMQMERACHRAGIPGELIPTPWQLTASCSMSWRCPLAAQNRLLHLIQQENLYYENMLMWP